MFATRNKCIATSNKCLTSRNKNAIRNKCLTSSNKKLVETKTLLVALPFQPFGVTGFPKPQGHASKDWTLLKYAWPK